MAKIKAYLKGKLRQFSNPKKEKINITSEKIESYCKMENIYANEHFNKNDNVNGFYIFRMLISENLKEEVYKLCLLLFRNDIQCTYNEQDLYFYGTAKNFARLINKFKYSIYKPNRIITRTEISRFLMYPAIYRNAMGSLENFDTDLYNDAISYNDGRNTNGIIFIDNLKTGDQIWFNKHCAYLFYEQELNDYEMILREDDILNNYKQGDTIVDEEETDLFDSSIDEII